MNVTASIVAILASFGAVVATATCPVVVLIKKSLPHVLPVAMTGFALLAAATTTWLGYWLWASGEALLMVLGVTILVFAVRLRKLRSQIEEAKGARDA